ncbi:hypothetical protein HPC49_10755 [Pyxidicoccus fallax]|uniref:Uncharacterized protein n=1 Tax=Pyxidicoccus fallax TaxID=394095 RepID=A0A848LAD5_9BACT|nr:hypothetical protein [Pyxidicoccus fallax]NMO15456.1 hypothetical protein [Pyxidicoccus fallax]NPC78721.1 hypothetical protein [Pyxidicoccus fallax]
MNQRVANKVNSILVSAYKFMGSVLLALILLGLISFLTVQGFFMVSRGWVSPTVVSPTDPEILTLNTQVAAQTSARDHVLAERRTVENRMADAERIIAAERSFQQRFQVALAGEKTSRDKVARRLASLQREYLEAREEIVQSNRAFSGLTRVRTDALYGARLLEQEDKLTINHHLAQLAQSNLSLAQTSVDLETRLESLQRESLGLAAVQKGLGKDTTPDGMTTDVLLLEREHTHSVLEMARAEATLKSLREDLKALDEVAQRYDMLIASLRASPYLRAIEKNLTVAFVPYENLKNAEVGTPLYACTAKLFWCHEVGVVGNALEGEVSIKHPIRQYMLRGLMVEIQLTDDASAREDLLHLSRPPMLL